MFEDISKYSQPRIKLFFNYLVNAAARVDKEDRRKSQLFAVQDLKAHDFKPESRPQQQPEFHYGKKQFFQPVPREVEERLENINDERKEMLETKIDMFFTSNKYLPYEIRLKKIKERYYKMRRSKTQDKAKLKKMIEKIKKCELMLRNVKKMDAQLLRKFHDV